MVSLPSHKGDVVDMTVCPEYTEKQLAACMTMGDKLTRGAALLVR